MAVERVVLSTLVIALLIWNGSKAARTCCEIHLLSPPRANHCYRGYFTNLCHLEEPRIMCDFAKPPDPQCEYYDSTSPDACRCLVKSTVRFGETCYNHSITISNHDNVTCHWSHNGTSLSSDSDQRFRTTGKSKEVLHFVNPVSYFYLGTYVLNCTNAATGDSNTAVLYMKYSDVSPRMFRDTDLPYIDQDVQRLDSNPVARVRQADGTFAATVIGPVRVKNINEYSARGTWCVGEGSGGDGGGGRSCCNSSVLHSQVPCSGALQGWTATYSLNYYTGYGLYSLEQDSGEVHSSSVQDVSFALVILENVVDTRRFSLPADFVSNSPFLMDSSQCPSEPGLALGVSIGSFVLGGASTLSVVLFVLCVKRLCRPPAKQQHECHSFEGKEVAVPGNRYQPLAKQESVSVSAVALLNPADNRSSCGEYDFYLSLDKGHKV